MSDAVGPISVVIPCYNAANYVGETIRSALAQTRPPAEIIVVDDASSDDSVAVAEKFGPPVRVLRSPKNGGAAVARNAGVRIATGQWIAFLDADDIWAADRLERLAAVAATAGPGDVCVFNDFYILQPDGSHTDRPTPIEQLEGDYLLRLLGDWLVNPSCLLVRTDAARAVPYPEGVRHVEDQQFVLLLRHHGRFLHVPEALTGYRRRAGQLTSRPDHGLIGFRANLAFAKSRPDLYPPAELERARIRLADQLLTIHESAYWKREFDVARECRRLYPQTHPHPDPHPRLFDAPLYPRWVMHAKDWADRILRGKAMAPRT